MEFRIAKSELLQGLARTQGVVERKSTMPVLANVCLTTKGTHLVLSATDLEVGLISKHGCETSKEGSITVGARALFDIVKELSDDKVHLKVMANNWVEIKSGKSHFKIVGLSADEFPKLPKGGGETSLTLDVEAFQEMVGKTAFSMSTDETRYNLNGVLLEHTNKRLRMVATDGHRLSYADRPVKGKWTLEKGVIIPRKGILEWKKLLDGAEGSFRLQVDPKHVTVEYENVTLLMRLIDGQYPPYDQVIPKAAKWVVSVEREAMQQALRRVQLVTTDRSRGVRFRLSPKHLEMMAKNPDVGEAHEELAANYQGETVEIGFNARFFADVLSVLPDEQVVLELKGEMGPCVIRSEFDRDFLCVIMPMRL
jgi:DNA polymerase III subunit beta